MARPKKMLQANDPIELNQKTPYLGCSDEEILQALDGYKKRGMVIELTPTLWTLSIYKTVKNTKSGSIIGGNTITFQGNRNCPLKDIIYSADELMRPLTSQLPVGVPT